MLFAFSRFTFYIFLIGEILSSIKVNSISNKLLNAIDFEDNQCSWKKQPTAPEIYYINMDRSINRKISMERHLNNVGLKHFRVRGNPWSEIYIPDDLSQFWTTAWCKSQVLALLNTNLK
jgi:hypothetical protein